MLTESLLLIAVVVLVHVRAKYIPWSQWKLFACTHTVKVLSTSYLSLFLSSLQTYYKLFLIKHQHIAFECVDFSPSIWVHFLVFKLHCSFCRLLSMGIVQITQESTEHLLSHFESTLIYWDSADQLSHPCASWAAAPTNRKMRGNKSQWVLPGYATATVVGTWPFFAERKMEMEWRQAKVEQQDEVREGNRN